MGAESRNLPGLPERTTAVSPEKSALLRVLLLVLLFVYAEQVIELTAEIRSNSLEADQQNKTKHKATDDKTSARVGIPQRHTGGTPSPNSRST